MKEQYNHTTGSTRQYVFSFLSVAFVSALCLGFASFMEYRVVALFLLLTVSLLAISFDILPVLTAALLSALIWVYIFIPPRFTFQIQYSDDIILFTMYFVIAMVNAVLTHKIKQAQELARQREEKAGAVKLYNTLLNCLSHELRTPIATIIGAADNLQTNQQNLKEQDKEELIAEISKASFRLNQQVENLLSMSRLESGFIQPRNNWCDVTEILYDAVRRVEDNRMVQKISINIHPDFPLFRLDKGMLEQIVYNLLHNAGQHTEADTRVQLTATCPTNLLQITVEDNGKGFPEDEIRNVFNKFYRLRNSRTGGTGLGLSIVKGFTEALGGTVCLDNVRMGGARFTIRIPAESAFLTENWSNGKDRNFSNR